MVIGFSMISDWAGVIALAVGIGRDATNYTMYKLKSEPNKYRITKWDTMSIFFWIAVVIAVSVPTVDTFLSWFAVFAAIVFTLAIWQKNILVFRLSSIIVQILWGVYMWHVDNTVGLYLRAVLITATLIGLFFYFKEQRKKKATQPTG